MLVRFLAKRVAVLAITAATFSLVIDGFNPTVPLGILLGAFLALYKTRMNQKAVSGSTSGSPVKNGIVQMLSQTLSLVFLAVAAFANVRLFLGAAIGLLLLPLIICLNAVTERLGVTRNAWGEIAGAEGRAPWNML